MRFHRELLIWMLLASLASNVLNAEIKGYEKSVTYLHKWNAPLNISDDCYKFHLFASHGVILKICTRAEKEDRTHVHPFKTYIENIDPSDDPISCTIPNFLANEVAVLGNHKILMQDYQQIMIVDKTNCDSKLVKIKAHGIIPQGSFFDAIIKSHQDRDQLLLRGSLSVKRYNDQGNFLSEFINVTQQRGELVTQGRFNDESNGKLKYFFVIHDVSQYSSRWGVVDIFNDSFDKLVSETIWPYVKAYSTAHDNFSICYEESGLKCVLYDVNFQPLHYVVVMQTNSKSLEDYHLVNVHNLLGGGSIVIFCEKVTDILCRLYYAVIDEHGRPVGKRSFGIESLYADGALLDPFTMRIDSVFKPKIFEIHAEHGIYCLVFPQNDSIHGVGITVRKIIKTHKT